MIRIVFYWIFLLLPVAVYALPNFQITFEEDIALTVCGVYLLLRAANPFRRELPPWIETSLFSLFLVVLYGIGWMGLWRGYGLLSGWSILIYPTGLCAAYLLQIKRIVSEYQAKKILLYAWLCMAWLLIIYCLVIQSVPFMQSSELFIRVEFYSAAMIGLAVTGLAVSLANHGKWTKSNRQLVPLFAAFAFALVMSWSANYQLWRTWYDASESARAWAPYQYVQEDEIRAARQAPTVAFMQYAQLLDAIENKGRIPKRMGWLERIHKQLVEQLERRFNFRLLQFLLRDCDSDEKRLSLVAKFTGHLFCEQYTKQQPVNSSSVRLFIDAEYDGETESYYLLDRWGGVSKYESGEIRARWRPAIYFDDAIDLEIRDGIFIVLRGNRSIMTSEPIAWLQGELSLFSMGGEVVDIELFESINSALIVSSKGEIAFSGQPPPHFPTWSQMYFREDVVVDLELDADERGYYLLDAYGAVHGNHADGQTTLAYRSPPIADGLVPYWAGQRMAIDLELDALSRGLNIYTREGELFTIAMKPYRNTYRPVTKNDNRGVALVGGVGARLFALESNGRVLELPSDVE